MTLTEQWKKGELDCGVYYVQSDDGVVFPSVYSAEYDSIKDISIKDFWYEIVDIKEVLAPVPSYEEWRELHKRLKDTQNLELEVRRENQQLKELLKDCRFILREMSDVNNWLESDDCVLNYDMATECEKYATKIDNAIGEKK